MYSENGNPFQLLAFWGGVLLVWIVGKAVQAVNRFIRAVLPKRKK